MRTAPIALFTFNRPNHTRQTVEALARNDLAAESELFVFSDGPRTPAESPAIESVREYIRKTTGFRSVSLICRPNNLGLSRSIISGVSQICDRYGAVIVVEDDIVTSPFFLRYMNDALRVYRDTPEVVCVHGYVYTTGSSLPETFFIRGADCWGWATWTRGWKIFEKDGAFLLCFYYK